MIARFAVFAAATVALATAASAQDPVKWTAKPSGALVPGGDASVKLSATIESGWHIYSLTQGPGGPIPTKITLPTGQLFAMGGDIKADAPDVKFDENFGINVETYETGADFTVPVKIDKTIKPGAQQVQINTRYQVCNASMCLPAKTEKLTVPLTVIKKKKR